MKYQLFGQLCMAIIVLIGTGCSNETEPVFQTPLTFDQVLDMGIEGCMEYYTVPGCTWMVVQADSIKAIGAAGAINTSSEEEITTAHRFQIGSMGKSFTGLIAATCIEKGLISWNTTIFDIFPEWKDDSRTDYHSLTLQDLFSHQTTLQPLNELETRINKLNNEIVYTGIPNFKGTTVERRMQFSQYALSLEPNHTTRLNYTNSGYCIAGCMLEKVSGKTYEELAIALADELEMPIVFGRPNADDPHQPWGHMYFSGNEVVAVAPGELKGFHDPMFAAAGNIAVTIEDFAKYILQFTRGLKNIDGVVASSSLQYLLKGIDGYSIGWYNDFTTESIYYHYGSEQTFTSNMMIFEDFDAAIVVFTNVDKGDDTINFINDVRNYLKVKYLWET